MPDRTLIIIKPDGIQRQLAGKMLSRFEEKGFKLIAAKFIRISEQLAEEHYSVHKGKPFFEGVVKYLSSGPSLVMVWEADGIIEMSRKMMGATFGSDAEPGTIRGDFSCSKGYNLIHGSDSRESYEYEVKLYFNDEEIIEYNLTCSPWLYGKNT